MNPAPSIIQMYQVYLIRSKRNGTFYIGYNNDVKRRLKEHNSGKVEYTRKYMPWTLVYYESFTSLPDAKMREKNLKHFGKAYKQLKIRIMNSLEGAG
jgi:putative endonuclease